MRSVVITAVSAFVLFLAVAPIASASTDDACSVVTQAQVSGALGVPMSPGAYVTPTFKRTCTWKPTSAGKIKAVTLFLQPADAFEKAKAIAVSPSAKLDTVGGLGEGAYYVTMGDQVGLMVKKGGVAFKVAVYATTTVDEKKALEKALAAEVASKL